MKENRKHVGVIPFKFDATASGDTTVAIPTEIHLIPIGQWEHDLYGPILITASDIREFEQNFNASVRKGVFITAGHEGFQELPACGWLTSVESRSDGLWGSVDWNDLGKATLSDKQYKYFSPEFYRDYEDPQSHQIYRNVMTGGALTKSPYFKELEAVVFSDRNIKKFTDIPPMDLNELLAKDVATLTDEEKAFINTKVADLTDEQKTALGDVLVAPEATETEDEKTAREAKEAGDANEAAGLNRDGSAKEAEAETVAEPEAPTAEQIQASEKVSMSAVEIAHLRKMADQGAQAFKELEGNKLDAAVGALSFSESNKAGRFLPKDKDALRSFMEGLNPAQRTTFSSLIANLPKAASFAEIGSGDGAAEGTAQAEVESKVEALMKADDKLKYSDALKRVMSENKGLEQRFDTELVPVGKAGK